MPDIAQNLVRQGISEAYASTLLSGSALICACVNGNDRLTRMLLEANADVEFKTENSSTALMISCGDVDGVCNVERDRCVRMLLEHGAAPDVTNNEGRFALWIACQRGADQAVLALVEAKADVDFHTRASGTALMAACANGHATTARLLLKHGASPNCEDDTGFTPLMITCVHGQDQCALALMKARVDANYIATTGGHSGKSALMIACEHGHERCVLALLSRGVDPNVRGCADGIEGLSALMIACDFARGRDFGWEACARALIEAKADLDAQDVRGNTGMMLAARDGNLRLVRALIVAGASVNIAGSGGDTAIHVACFFSKLDVQHQAVHGADRRCQAVQMLIKAKADAAKTNSDGDAPLAIASAYGNEQCVSVLIEANVDIDHQNRVGDTALAIACDAGSEQCVRLLVKAGAALELVGDDGITALDAAERNGHAAIATMLVGAARQRRAKDALSAALALAEAADGDEEAAHAALRDAVNEHADAGGDDDSTICAQARQARDRLAKQLKKRRQKQRKEKERAAETAAAADGTSVSEQTASAAAASLTDATNDATTFAPTTFVPTTFVPTTFVATTFDGTTTFVPTAFVPTTFVATTFGTSVQTAAAAAAASMTDATNDATACEREGGVTAPPDQLVSTAERAHDFAADAAVEDTPASVAPASSPTAACPPIEVQGADSADAALDDSPEPIAATSSQAHTPPPALAPAPVEVRAAELSASTLAFAAEREIGRGGCGVVYRADPLPSMAVDAGPVAVKRLLARGSHAKRELQVEVQVLSRCQHPHVLRLHGYCLDPRSPCLVYPLARGGNLEDRLLRTPDGLRRLALLGCDAPPPLPWQTRVRVLCESLRALTYLHGLTPSVLHRDVKPSNVLLDGRCHALLSDVGMAREDAATARRTHYTTANVRGTPGYLDPLVTNSLHHSEMTDGYAFGVTVLVALVGQPALDLRRTCRRLLGCPEQPERWERPGVPDAAAGGWPEQVAVKLATVVAGLTKEFPEDRVPLSEALAVLESVAATMEEEPATFTCGGTGEEAKLEAAATVPAPEQGDSCCLICEDAPREVRFRCGHASCCRACLALLRDDVAKKAALLENLDPQAARAAAEKAVARCPVCREPIGDEVAALCVEQGGAPTFVLGTAAAAIERDDGFRVAGRGKRGGRGGRGRARA